MTIGQKYKDLVNEGYWFVITAIEPDRYRVRCSTGRLRYVWLVDPERGIRLINNFNDYYKEAS